MKYGIGTGDWRLHNRPATCPPKASSALAAAHLASPAIMNPSATSHAAISA
jgi:hypothetical protein